MSFHPDSNLPGCMMPDGGDCCAGHATVVEDWHKQRQEIERLRGLLEEIATFTSDPVAESAAREALVPPAERGAP